MLGLKQNTSYLGACLKYPLLIVSLLLSFQVFATEKPKVFSSIRPLALLVQDLAGDLVESHVLIDGSASPHDFSLTIAQALDLNEAALLVWVGPKFETFLNAGTLPEQQIAMSDFVKPNDSHDMHLWLGVNNMALLADRLSDELKVILPQSNATIDTNLKRFQKAIKERKEKTDNLLSKYRERPFAVHHDGYGEYVEEYKLTQAVNLTSVPHERLSARKLQALGEGMNSAYCLLAEKGEEHEAERYAKLFEKDLVLVDLLATDQSLTSFDSYLVALSESFRSCLTQKRP